MRSGLLRAVVAVTAGLALMLGAAPPPAQAADVDDYADVTLDVLGALLVAAEDGISPGEIIALVQLLRGAVDGVKVDVVDRLDSQVVVELRAKVDSTLAKTYLLDSPFPWDTSIFNNSTHDAAYLARRYVLDDVLTADKDVDAVGRAMMTLFTAYEVGLAKAGVAKPARDRIFAEYRQGLERLIAKMVPRCSVTGTEEPFSAQHVCTYNGKTVRGVPGNDDRALVENQLMADTARKLAQDALEQLRQRNL